MLKTYSIFCHKLLYVQVHSNPPVPSACPKPLTWSPSPNSCPQEAPLLLHIPKQVQDPLGQRRMKPGPFDQLVRSL